MHFDEHYYFQLEKRVQFHEHLRPVCLPTANTQLIPGTLCTVIGWGKKNDTDSTYLKILRLVDCDHSNQIGLSTASEYELAVNEVQVPVLNRKVCNFWIAYKEMNVTEGMICAGYPDGGKDACQVSLIEIFFNILIIPRIIHRIFFFNLFNRAILEVHCCARTNKIRRNGLSVE